MGGDTTVQTNEAHDSFNYASNGQQPPEKVRTKEEMELVFAAMMEELGMGRKDTLPLQDRGLNIEDLPAVKPMPKRQLLRNQNQGAAAWRNAVFDDVDPAEAELDSIADGQLYRLRRGASSGHQQYSARRGLSNLHQQSSSRAPSLPYQHRSSTRGSSNAYQQQLSGRGAHRGGYQPSGTRGGVSPSPSRTRSRVSKRGDSSSHIARGSFSNSVNPRRSALSHGSSPLQPRPYFKDDSQHKNPGQYLSANPRIEQAIERIREDLKKNKTSKNHQPGNALTKSKPIAPATSELAPQYVLEPTVPLKKQAIGDPPMAKSKEPWFTSELAKSIYADPEDVAVWRTPRRLSVPITPSSSGKRTLLKEIRVKFRKQNEDKEDIGTLSIFKFEKVSTLSMEIHSDDQLVLNDVLYAESGFVTGEDLTIVTYRPAQPNSAAWVIRFPQAYNADKVLSIIQASESMASISSTLDVIEQADLSITTADAIQSGVFSPPRTGLAINPELSFIVSTDDEEWLIEYFGNTAKNRILDLHTKVLSSPNAETDVLGSVWSGNLPYEDVRAEIHLEIRRIFQGRLATTFHPENQKIQIRPFSTLNINPESTQSIHPPNGLTRKVLDEVPDVSYGPLISFSDHDDFQSDEVSENFKDLMDINDEEIVEGIYGYLSSNSRGSIIEQLSTLVPAQEKSPFEMTKDELLFSKSYFVAALNMAGRYFTSSDAFNTLPEEVISSQMQGKVIKAFERAVIEFYKHNDTQEDDSKDSNDDLNGLEDNSGFVRPSSEQKPAVRPGLEASRWAPQEVRNQHAAALVQEATKVMEQVTHCKDLKAPRTKYTMESLVLMKGGAIDMSLEKFNTEVAYLYRPSPAKNAEPKKVNQIEGNSAFAIRPIVTFPAAISDSQEAVDETSIAPLFDDKSIANRPSPERQDSNTALGPVMRNIISVAASDEAAALTKFESAYSESSQAGESRDINTSLTTPMKPLQSLQSFDSDKQPQGTTIPWQRFAAGHRGPFESKISSSPVDIKHKPTNSDCERLAQQMEGLKLAPEFLPCQPTPAVDSTAKKLESILDGPSDLEMRQKIAHQRLRSIVNHMVPSGFNGSRQLTADSVGLDQGLTTSSNVLEGIVIASVGTEGISENDSQVQSSIVDKRVLANQPPLTCEVQIKQASNTLEDAQPFEPSAELPGVKPSLPLNGGLAASIWANAPDGPSRRRHPVIPKNDPAFQSTYYTRQVPDTHMPLVLPAIGFPLQSVLVPDLATGRIVKVMAMVPAHSHSGLSQTQTPSFTARQENVPFQAMTPSKQSHAEQVLSPSQRPALSPVRHGDNVQAELNMRLKQSLADRTDSLNTQL